MDFDVQRHRGNTDEWRERVYATGIIGLGASSEAGGGG